MSKNKYILPFKGEWYVEYGGSNKSNSHSWDIISQRYAFDFEIRVSGLPYHDDYRDVNNYYCYLEDVICPCDGFVIDVCDKYIDTKIYEGRVIKCDVDDCRGNYITIKHKYGECSTICHLMKGSIKVNVGDIVSEGQVIGKVGNSGNTEGPHIHFQVQQGDDFINSKGIKVSFKNTYTKNRKVKNIEKGMYVYTK